MTDPIGSSMLVDVIAAFPGLADQLFAEHVDDGHGRCRSCELGAQAGHHTWPCRLHLLATAARRARQPG
jgi:hypothetical protein